MLVRSVPLALLCTRRSVPTMKRDLFASKLSLFLYHSENNEVERAKKSLQFYRGPNFDITEELREIELKHESKKKQNSNHSWKFTLQRIFSSAFFKPFSCIGVLYIINTWSGFNCLLVYMISILDESGSNIDPNVGPIIVGSCRVAFAGGLISNLSLYFSRFQLISKFSPVTKKLKRNGEEFA